MKINAGINFYTVKEASVFFSQLFWLKPYLSYYNPRPEGRGNLATLF